jgi:hypothetical protein
MKGRVGMVRGFGVLRKKKREEPGRELTVRLDAASVARLERLRRRFKHYDDSRLVGFALQTLEGRIHRLVKRQVLRKMGVSRKKAASGTPRGDPPQR